MKGVAVVDTNLAVLLVVGSASRNYIRMHDRLHPDYTVDDFDLLGLILADFSELVLLPHILVEVSHLARQVRNPARRHVVAALKVLITTVPELPVHSSFGARREEFERLGLTDAVILHLCGIDLDGISPTLVTVDTELADAAHSLGYSVIDYKREFQSG